MALALLAFALALAAPEAAEGGSRTVRCGEAVQRTVFPYRGGARPDERYRLVLGVLSAPPAYLPQVSDTRRGPWRYWRKQGLVVREGAGPVTISVPPAWRGRVAIDWGNAGNGGPFASVAFPRCGSNGRTGRAYVGGFSLVTPSACVPLLVRAGGRTATVLFGIGRRCPG